MPHTQLSLATVALLLCAYSFHSCQQPMLNAREEDGKQTAPQAQTPQTKLGTEAPATHRPSDAILTMTSSSDSSPGHAGSATPDHDSQDQLMANASQGNALSGADTDTTITEVNGKKAAGKRPATTRLDRTEEPQAAVKQAKKEVPSTSHKAWFTSFTQAAVQIEQNLRDEAAWDHMEHVLDEGEKNDFLAASIVWPNDSNPNTQYEYTPLHYAAARGLLELVRELVEKRNVGADLPTNGKKNTPLHMAAAGGHLDIVAYLVQQGKVEISKTDHQGASALHYAAAGKYGENNRDVIKYLVQINKEEGTKCTCDHLSVLELAVHADNAPVVAYWLAEFNSKDNNTVKEHIENALKMAKAMPGRETITHLLKGS